ncbi:protein cramped [Onthophagus taurus]|uniref:protein cramped n=1 Tax=Onthophagus taurus TaxID=166361 RepID=UPI000C1FE329|nr:protein cramped [Onthophagus taurus]
MANNELPVSCKFILDQQIPIDELLGSVTTYNNVEGSEAKNMQIRASARVFKKMKLDSTPTQTLPSPIIEKKEPIKEESKPEGRRPLRLWDLEDKKLFFEALNEYGKDFEAIHAYITTKLKKKGVPEYQYKTREQIRHLYYRTWHKISKHLIFSEEVKKVAQELYGLINYGELRKKLLFVSEKACMKLNELIYRGSVAIRTRGKTIRVRTPICRALRILNQLDDGHNDLKLPLKINVELKPKDMDTWMVVQKLSQNPRIKTTVPLQRRVSALLLYLNDKWKTYETTQYETALKQTEQVNESQIEDFKPPINLLRFSPPPNCKLDVPTLNVTEYLTSQNVCLNSYEERFGVETKGEDLWLTSLSSSSKANLKKIYTKRARHESNSSTNEKLSPLTSTINTVINQNNCAKCEGESVSQQKELVVTDVVDQAVNTILSLQVNLLKDDKQNEANNSMEIKIESDEINGSIAFNEKKEVEVTELMKGWTVNNCGTLCVGDLYLMYGSDSKLTLEYSWDQIENKEVIEHDITNQDVVEEYSSQSNKISNILKRLLSMAKLHYRKNRIQCPCGHICGGVSKNKNRTTTKVITGREKFYNNADKPTSIDPQLNNTTLNNEPALRRVSPSVLFRRPGSPNDLLMAQLDSIQKLRPRYCNRKGRRPRTKPVVVERKLPILANRLEDGRQIVQMSIISQENVAGSTQNTNPRPIAPKTTQENETQLNNSEKSVSTYSLVSILTPHQTVSETVNVINDNAITPSRAGSPSDISNLIQLALNSNNGEENDEVAGEEPTSFVGLLPTTTIVTSATPPTSPSRVLKENEDQWLNAEVADFSFSSFLGHLESPIKAAQSNASCASEDSRLCLTQAVQSLLTESSLDYTAKFADLAAKVTDIQK